MTELLRTAAAARKVRDEAEQTVVTALLDQLGDGWYVIPQVAFDGKRNSDGTRSEYEIDVVLAHRDHGFGIVETKGYASLVVSAGRFMHHGREVDKQPGDQLRRNRHALANLLARAAGREQPLQIDGLVAFPNLAELNGDLPLDLSRDRIVLSGALDADTFGLADAVEDVLFNRWNVPLDETEFQQCLLALCPDATFVTDRGARARRARNRLREVCDDRTAALEELDVNRRIMITGGAGSGKTRLALRWVQRALNRGERVLLVSYNDPLGEELAGYFGDRERLTVGPFLRVVRDLPGIPPLDEPPGAGDTWWNRELPDHIAAHLDASATRFDTIVVDEAQDFAQHWTAVIERLLAGPKGKLFLLADSRQDLYGRGFHMPEVDDGWVRCALTVNTRNSRPIAQLLRRRFSGASGGHRLPDSDAIRTFAVHDLDAATAVVAAELQRLDDAGVEPHDILVATIASSMRDHLRHHLGLVAWEGRGDAVVCENVHRAKGTEYDEVILVDAADTTTLRQERHDQLLYVGVSRAVFGLTVVAGDATLERLGLQGAVPSGPVGSGT